VEIAQLLVGLAVLVSLLFIAGVVWEGRSYWTKPAPVVSLPKPVPVRSVVLRLMDEDGVKDIGAVTVEARFRRPSVRARGTDGRIGQFVASHQVDGQWVYRRVAVEREH
jgi:hypothetical protein